MKSQKIPLSYSLRSKKLDFGDMGPEDVSRHKSTTALQFSQTGAPNFPVESNQTIKSLKNSGPCLDGV